MADNTRRTLAEIPAADQSREKAMSRYWRVNRSHHETTELALVLRALRKVAGHIGNNVKPVRWGGMGSSDKGHISVNAEQIMGTYPISFKKMDLLVGRVVREAYCSIAWTEWVIARVKEQAPPDSATITEYLDHIIAAGEDIYIRELSKSTVFSLYLDKYWKYIDCSFSRDPTLPPTAASLGNTWRMTSLWKTLPSNLHHHYRFPLRLLSAHLDTIKRVAGSSSMAERRNRRVRIYLHIWCIIYKSILEWESFDAGDDAIKIHDESGPKTNVEDIEHPREGQDDPVTEENAAGEEIDPDFADRINAITDSEETDLTLEIAVAIEEPEAREMKTNLVLGKAESSVAPDPMQVRRLRKVFQQQRTLHRRARKKHWVKSLDQGRLDHRRLYRWPVDGKIFRFKLPHKQDYSWNIAICSDASASMSGRHRIRPWETTEKAFVSLVEAAKGSKNRLQVYGYHEENGGCVLIKLFHSGKVFTTVPSGKTPSGQAIMASALTMGENARRNLIIHITDGAANCGLHVSAAVGYCKNNNIDLITIGCGCNEQTQEFLRNLFPEGHLLLMDSVRSLPMGLEGLFRQKLCTRRNP